MSNVLSIQPAVHPIRKTICVPGSKSITNRALILAALARGESRLENVLLADDTLRMIEALRQLGFTLHHDQAAQRVVITGQGGQVTPTSATLYCGNSGTTIRFLTAMLTLAHGSYTLDGNPRMRQRPITQLVDALRTLGCKVTYTQNEGYPPIVINAQNQLAGSCVISDAQSSQYISALMMAAGAGQHTVTIQQSGAATSEPYVQMTAAMMRQFSGPQVGFKTNSTGREITIPPASGYQGRNYLIEPDASNASYFLAAAAIVPGSAVTIANLGKPSLQGDIAVAEVLQAMGAGLAFGPDFVTVTFGGELRAITMDMNHIPDMVQTIGVVALFAQGTTLLTNVGNLRIKETDRLLALETELRKFGAEVATGPDWIRITPPAKPIAAQVATYDDHRMAMAFAVAGLRVAGTQIHDPQCCEKTYPEFFQAWDALHS
jgi:3-phosphoshikimate 1-carboxyvinyltransferase